MVSLCGVLHVFASAVSEGWLVLVSLYMVHANLRVHFALYTHPVFVPGGFAKLRVDVMCPGYANFAFDSS